MKRFLFSTFFLAAALFLPAQDYIPLVQEQATLIMHRYWEGGQELYGYRIEGDTLIDNVAYKKVFRLSFYTSPPPDLYVGPPYKKNGQVLFGAIREDLAERKVYARIFAQTEVEARCTDPGAEKLWHDFSLTVGDTLASCISNVPGNPEEVYPITSMDTAFLFGENRRRWCIWDGFFYCQVEGLGTGDGLFDHNFGKIVIDEGDFYLRHFCIGSESECDIVDVTSVRDLSLPASAISIAPNPANGLVHISLTGQEERIEGFVLYNLSGQLLCKWQGSNLPIQELDVKDIPPGFYFLRIYSSKGIGLGKLLVKG
ncbi:MAG: T9SS type A sorting domain-containing protein [Lewinellaceae bacterium]|nr:T9SS type A sorting domain-containing protein [Lewinellaceae bacterium]